MAQWNFESLDIKKGIKGGKGWVFDGPSFFFVESFNGNSFITSLTNDGVWPNLKSNALFQAESLPIISAPHNADIACITAARIGQKNT